MPDGRSDPTRDDVTSHWVALIERRSTREAVHDWAAQWVGKVPVSDPMVDTALLYLHGFGLTVGPNPSYSTRRESGEYMHSDEEIVRAYERWRADCVKYDTDREGYLREKRAAAHSYLEREGRKKDR
jgi:hypothetical protein